MPLNSRAFWNWNSSYGSLMIYPKRKGLSHWQGEMALLSRLIGWVYLWFMLDHQSWTQDGCSIVNWWGRAMGNRVGSYGRFGYRDSVDAGECVWSLEMGGLFPLVNWPRPFLFGYILKMSSSSKSLLSWEALLTAPDLTFLIGGLILRCGPVLVPIAADIRVKPSDHRVADIHPREAS